MLDRRTWEKYLQKGEKKCLKTLGRTGKMTYYITLRRNGYLKVSLSNSKNKFKRRSTSQRTKQHQKLFINEKNNFIKPTCCSQKISFDQSFLINLFQTLFFIYCHQSICFTRSNWKSKKNEKKILCENRHNIFDMSTCTICTNIT